MKARAWTRVAALTGAALLSGGCGEDGPAVDLRFVVDLSINTEPQVASAIDTLVMIVDSPEGLYPPGSEHTDGDTRVFNFISADEDLELVVTTPVTEDHLPTIRLLRGGLPDAPLDLWFRGLPAADAADASAQAVAEYRLRGIEIGAGRTDIDVPLNLYPEFLPPRVDTVYPADGQVLTNCRSTLIVVTLSKEVTPETLLAPGNVELEPAGIADIFIPGPDDLTTLPERAGRIVQIYPATPTGVNGETQRLRISSAVRDLSGQALDQIPAMDGAQGFESTFMYMDCPIAEPSTTPPPPCSPTDPDGFCPPEATCDGGLCTFEGSCLPCPDGSACDPIIGLCEIDCRLYPPDAYCPVDRPSCDPGTGACV